MIHLVAFQPDIPQNLGALMRLCACLNVTLEIIEPCNFPLGDKGLQRVAMDYPNHLKIVRWANWEQFIESKPKNIRLILLSTKAKLSYHQFSYKSDDYLIVGSESMGVPNKVWDITEKSLRIPIRNNSRSLNVVSAASIVLGEALKQTNGFIL